MKKIIKVYKVYDGGFHVRIPLYMARELDLLGEDSLEIENKPSGELILKKIEKNIKKNVDN